MMLLNFRPGWKARDASPAELDRVITVIRVTDCATAMAILVGLGNGTKWVN
jgi:hypothetical protein